MQAGQRARRRCGPGRTARGVLRQGGV